jgi:4'-phosphopantetheinyl transferase
MKISTPAIDQKLRSHKMWAQAQLPRPFPRGRIDVWRLRLDEPPTEASATIILSPDEAKRANRFHFERDRIYFSQCRSTLRRLLASYLAMPAAEISFEYLASGKPRLIAAQNPHGLQFNVSHSANMALIAVGSYHQLGVDIEKIRADVDTTSLAERFFSLRERAGLQALPEQLGVSGFFACWTRKEAFLKATGEGLSFPLADFSVSTHPDRDPVLEEIKGNTEAGKQWFLADLSVAPGFRATVATGHSRSRVETYAWN